MRRDAFEVILRDCSIGRFWASSLFDMFENIENIDDGIEFETLQKDEFKFLFECTITILSVKLAAKLYLDGESVTAQSLFVSPLSSSSEESSSFFAKEASSFGTLRKSSS